MNPHIDKQPQSNISFSFTQNPFIESVPTSTLHNNRSDAPTNIHANSFIDSETSFPGHRLFKYLMYSKILRRTLPWNRTRDAHTFYSTQNHPNFKKIFLDNYYINIEGKRAEINIKNLIGAFWNQDFEVIGSSGPRLLDEKNFFTPFLQEDLEIPPSIYERDPQQQNNPLFEEINRPIDDLDIRFWLGTPQECLDASRNIYNILSVYTGLPATELFYKDKRKWAYTSGKSNNIYSIVKLDLYKLNEKKELVHALKIDLSFVNYLEFETLFQHQIKLRVNSSISHFRIFSDIPDTRIALVSNLTKCLQFSTPIQENPQLLNAQTMAIALATSLKGFKPPPQDLIWQWCLRNRGHLSAEFQDVVCKHYGRQAYLFALLNIFNQIKNIAPNLPFIQEKQFELLSEQKIFPQVPKISCDQHLATFSSLLTIFAYLGFGNPSFKVFTVFNDSLLQYCPENQKSQILFLLPLKDALSRLANIQFFKGFILERLYKTDFLGLPLISYDDHVFQTKVSLKEPANPLKEIVFFFLALKNYKSLSSSLAENMNSLILKFIQICTTFSVPQKRLCIEKMLLVFTNLCHEVHLSHLIAGIQKNCQAQINYFGLYTHFYTHGIKNLCVLFIRRFTKQLAQFPKETFLAIFNSQFPASYNLKILEGLIRSGIVTPQESLSVFRKLITSQSTEMSDAPFIHSFVYNLCCNPPPVFAEDNFINLFTQELSLHSVNIARFFIENIHLRLKQSSVLNQSLKAPEEETHPAIILQAKDPTEITAQARNLEKTIEPQPNSSEMTFLSRLSKITDEQIQAPPFATYQACIQFLSDFAKDKTKPTFNLESLCKKFSELLNFFAKSAETVIYAIQLYAQWQTHQIFKKNQELLFTCFLLIKDQVLDSKEDLQVNICHFFFAHLGTYPVESPLYLPMLDILTEILSKVSKSLFLSSKLKSLKGSIADVLSAFFASPFPPNLIELINVCHLINLQLVLKPETTEFISDAILENCHDLSVNAIEKAYFYMRKTPTQKAVYLFAEKFLEQNLLDKAFNYCKLFLAPHQTVSTLADKLCEKKLWMKHEELLLMRDGALFDLQTKSIHWLKQIEATCKSNCQKAAEQLIEHAKLFHETASQAFYKILDDIIKQLIFKESPQCAEQALKLMTRYNYMHADVWEESLKKIPPNSAVLVNSLKQIQNYKEYSPLHLKILKTFLDRGHSDPCLLDLLSEEAFALSSFAQGTHLQQTQARSLLFLNAMKCATTSHAQKLIFSQINQYRIDYAKDYLEADFIRICLSSPYESLVKDCFLYFSLKETMIAPSKELWKSICTYIIPNSKAQYLYALQLLSQPGFSNYISKKIKPLVTLLNTVLKEVEETRSFATALLALNCFTKHYNVLSKSFTTNPEFLHLALKVLPILLIDQENVTKEFTTIYQKIVSNNPLLFPNPNKQPSNTPLKTKNQKQQPDEQIDKGAHSILFRNLVILNAAEKVKNHALILAASHLRVILTTPSVNKKIKKVFFMLLNSKVRSIFEKNSTLIIETLSLVNTAKKEQLFSDKEAYTIAYDIAMQLRKPKEDVAQFRYDRSEEQHLNLWLLNIMVECEMDLKSGLDNSVPFIQEFFMHLRNKRIMIHPSEELLCALTAHQELLDNPDLHPFLIKHFNQNFQPDWIDKKKLNYALAKTITSCLDLSIANNDANLVYEALQCCSKYQLLDFHKNKQFHLKVLSASSLLLKAPFDDERNMQDFYPNIFNADFPPHIIIKAACPEDVLEYVHAALISIFNTRITEYENLHLALIIIQQNFELALNCLPDSSATILVFFEKLLFSPLFSRQQSDIRLEQIETMHLALCQNIMRNIMPQLNQQRQKGIFLMSPILQAEFELFEQILLMKPIAANVNRLVLNNFLSTLYENTSERNILIAGQTLKYCISSIIDDENAHSLLGNFLKSRLQLCDSAALESYSLLLFCQTLIHLKEKFSEQTLSYVPELIAKYISVIKKRTEVFFTIGSINQRSCMIQKQLLNAGHLAVTTPAGPSSEIALACHLDYLNMLIHTKNVFKAHGFDEMIDEEFILQITNHRTYLEENYNLAEFFPLEYLSDKHHQLM